ncbi:MAG: FAD-dependent oxidoreductase [Planctomycetaceae bacterium]
MLVDAIIFGGGAAGLWTLDELVAAGRSALLLEAAELGGGQTVASQGIIHGGLKYALQGWLTGSAKAIRDMPGVWRDCLAGRRSPDLARTRVRSECCHLWRTDTLASRVGMLGARFGLAVAPQLLNPDERPEALRRCPGPVARLDEQVVSPRSFIENLFDQHRRRILRIDADEGLSFDVDGFGDVRSVGLTNPETGERFRLSPRNVIFAAGAGNAELRRRVGLAAPVMQRRPLHMVLARGPLPELNGHCVDGAKTRVTITTDVDSAGRTVWQIGGQIAEEGIALEGDALIARAQAELTHVIPELSLAGVEWATYRVDRAEAIAAGGKRPEDVQVLRDANVVTAWPTKLALVPRLARELARGIDAGSSPSIFETLSLSEWPRPSIALPPWETATRWATGDLARTTGDRAA